FDLLHERRIDGSSKGASDKERFIQCRDLFALRHGSFPQTSFTSRKSDMGGGGALGGGNGHHNHIVASRFRTSIDTIRAGRAFTK
ncbi:MAG: hypothetical protein WAP47_11145, partial [Candidatus Rokuibacteriota bacterium]